MRIVKLLILTMLVGMLASCRHKDFCWHHPHGNIFIEVEYDDDNDIEDAIIIRDKIYATRILTYCQSTGEMVFASDMDRTTNLLPLDEDIYHCIAYNAGTQWLTFSDNRYFYTHNVFTRECDILEPFYGSRATKSDIDLNNGQPVVTTCEPIWSAALEGKVCSIGDTIRMKAIPLHCRYTFEMRNIEGLGGVVRASSFITGMSRGADLGPTALHDVPVTVAVPAEVGKDGKSIVGSFMCFGNNPTIGCRHRMGLFLEFADGTRYKIIDGINLDVTDQVVSAKNRRRVHIVIDGINIPRTPSSDNGFEIIVNPWVEGENKDIEYGF